MSRAHSPKLSMCSSSSSQVNTPGVESGATKFGHWLQFGYAPTSLHMSSQIPASLFWTCDRRARSEARHDAPRSRALRAAEAKAPPGGAATSRGASLLPPPLYSDRALGR
eukprot:CAMPEP_0179115296 /NCGR_PEP_ID=MMETSP0796-20121207/54027_1 /TAXON_ID=73915 /ORGANISM="Pyrodinium bahamense, Strain pbaha01" /LENGTH=109 /DNA_ID=CAMNT_0020813543 /DNA_START=123 /DNA_END=453 /DNA_ORIENTATION=-